MKKFFDCLTDFFASIARARVATAMVRQHRYDDARKEMLK